MHIIIGLAAGVALLYFWLVGNWFARVLVFLPLGATLAYLGFYVGAAMSTPGAAVTMNGGGPIAVAVLCSLVAAAAAWPIASLPIYYRRHQLKVKAVG